MEVQASRSFNSRFKGMFTGKDYYKTNTGLEISAQKGSGKVEVTDDGVVKVYDAKKVSIYGTKGDDKIYVANSHVKYIAPGLGDNKTFLDKCTFKKYSNFWGTGSIIRTGGLWSSKKGSDEIRINGDFNGRIAAQQGDGKGWGDKKAHKDTILINGNNTGRIEIDSKDKVAIKGPEKGKVINTTYIVY